MTEPDKVIWRHQLQAMMMVSGETIRRWMKSGKLPEPVAAGGQSERMES